MLIVIEPYACDLAFNEYFIILENIWKEMCIQDIVKWDLNLNQCICNDGYKSSPERSGCYPILLSKSSCDGYPKSMKLFIQIVNAYLENVFVN